MILLDLGSNVDTKAVQLVDFAAIGDQVSKPVIRAILGKSSIF